MGLRGRFEIKDSGGGFPIKSPAELPPCVCDGSWANNLPSWHRTRDDTFSQRFPTRGFQNQKHRSCACGFCGRRHLEYRLKAPPQRRVLVSTISSDVAGSAAVARLFTLAEAHTVWEPLRMSRDVERSRTRHPRLLHKTDGRRHEYMVIHLQRSHWRIESRTTGARGVIGCPPCKQEPPTVHNHVRLRDLGKWPSCFASGCHRGTLQQKLFCSTSQLLTVFPHKQ